MVGVIAHQCGEVEGDAQTGLTLIEQVFEALVRFFCGAEACEHAHRPQFGAVQGGVNAASVGILARVAEGGVVIKVRDIERSVKSIDRFGGCCDEFVVAFGELIQSFLERGLLPLRK